LSGNRWAKSNVLKKSVIGIVVHIELTGGVLAKATFGQTRPDASSVFEGEALSLAVTA